MTWSRFFLPDYCTRREFERVDDRIRTQIRVRAAASRTAEARVDELEEENARLALMLRAVIEANVRAGVFTHQQLQEITTEVDLWDGRQDNRYGAPPRRDEVDDDSQQSPHEFLGDLEKRDDL